MASEVEEQGVEKQGYFRFGFGSFMPHNPLRFKQQLLASRRQRVNQQQQQQQARHHTKGTGPHKQALSLPAIRVSKLRDRPPRKQTQSLKLASEVPGNADCSYCHDTSKKRLLPSLAASCVLPKTTGVVSDSSWWEWSKKEYRIKQTKFGLDDPCHYEPGETDVNGSLLSGTHLLDGGVGSSKRPYYPGM